MKMILSAMIRRFACQIAISLIVGSILWTPINSFAMTITAASCSSSDVMASIVSASAGDVVVVPPGVCTWASTITISKGITLQGSGIGVTTIVGNTSSTLVSYNPASPELNETFRLTGFTLNGGSAAITVLRVTNSSKTAIISNIRIDHNRIENSSTGASSQGVLVDRMVYGVVDHNEILNNASAFRILGYDDYSWADPLLVGSARSLYIEDNVISGLTAINGGYVIISSSGARWVFRYNTVDVSGTGDPIIDAHGNLPDTTCAWAGYNRGVVGIEVYENTFNNFNRTSGRIIDIRSGTAIVFNNSINGSVNGCNASIQVREEDDNTVGGACYPVKISYPGYDPVKDSYLWNNTLNGSPACFVNADSTVMIIDKQDVWSDVVSWNKGVNSYFIKGLSSERPSTCSEKSVFWETDNSRLYRCMQTDHWQLVYSPYRHPYQRSLEVPSNLRAR